MDADAIYEAMYGDRPEGTPGTVKYSRDEKPPPAPERTAGRDDPAYVHRTRENVGAWSSPGSSPMADLQRMLTAVRGGLQFTMKLDDLDDDLFKTLWGRSRDDVQVLKAKHDAQAQLYMRGVQAAGYWVDELSDFTSDVLVPGMQRVGSAIHGTIEQLRELGMIAEELPTEPKARALALRQRRNTGPDNRPRLDGRRARR